MKAIPSKSDVFPSGSLGGLVLLAAVSFLWWASSRIFDVPTYVVPAPASVFDWLRQNAGLAARDCLASASVAVAALLCSILVGVSVGALAAMSRAFNSIVVPIVIASNAVPIPALLPLLLMTMGYGVQSRLMVAFLFAVFPIVVGTVTGLLRRDERYEQLFSVFGYSKAEYAVRYRLVVAVPDVLSGVKVAASYSMIGAIVSEFMGSSSGIGFAMVSALKSSNAPKLYAYILLATLMGLTLYGSAALTGRIIRAKVLRNQI